MTNAILKFTDKLLTILQCLPGWIIAIALCIGNFFAGHRTIVLLVIAVTVIDAFWGIAVSIHKGEFALSELARLTVSKLAVYGCAMVVFVGLDKIADTVLTATLVGSAIVLVEFWSSCASMLILYPDFIFLRLLSNVLTGEIARKLKISEDEVKAAQEKQKEERERIRKEKAAAKAAKQKKDENHG